MHCPKHPQEALQSGELGGELKAYCCHICNGSWVTSEDYQVWQAGNADPKLGIKGLAVPISQSIDYQPSRYDNRAGLCPSCGFYLVRGRINLGQVSFFIERCPGCKGTWLDEGEWEALTTLGLSAYIPFLFTDEWQGHVRAAEAEFREQTATAEKLGPEIAAKLFELAKLLEDHPNGDFGVAYLMRRFENP
ncbi:MAG: zf-TFIIB domain-containing protein [Cyanobacteria bacterium P01_D01_bin.156]